MNASTLSTQRTLPFAPEVVYDAFARAELLAAWWGPTGFTNTFEVFEFRPGGAWKFVMHGPDGTQYPNQSIFQALEPAALVVIRHDCAPFFTLSVKLSSVPGGTLVVWQQAFDDSATAQAVQSLVGPANEQNLDRLTHVLAQGAG